MQVRPMKRLGIKVHKDDVDAGRKYDSINLMKTVTPICWVAGAALKI